MKTLNISTICVIALAFIIITKPASAQVTIELGGGAGYTAVDLEKWSGGIQEDWDQFMHQFYAQLFFTEMGAFTVGIEGGYQSLFWNQVRIPFGEFPIRRYQEAVGGRAMGVARIGLSGNLFADFGLGAYFFDGWTDFGLAGALGYKMNLSSKLDFLIKLRGDIIMDDTVFLPVNASAGFAIRL